MQRKGIAIQTILLLLIGVIVAGMIIYVAYKSFSSPTLGKEECRSKMVSYCTSCYVAGWAYGPHPSEDLKKCSKYHFDIAWSPNFNDCGAPVGRLNDCKAFIPL